MTTGELCAVMVSAYSLCNCSDHTGMLPEMLIARIVDDSIFMGMLKECSQGLSSVFFKYRS